MGQIIPVNKSYGDFFLVSVEEINWDEANDTWDQVYANKYYATYLQEEYGITVPPPYEVIWDHAITLQVFVELGGKPGDDTYLHAGNGSKDKKKKIKLIFMIDDLEKVFEKDKNNQVKVEFKNQVENQLSEQFGQKVILEDVQIIHR